MHPELISDVFLNGVLFITGYKREPMFMKILTEHRCDIKITFDP